MKKGLCNGNTPRPIFWPDVTFIYKDLLFQNVSFTQQKRPDLSSISVKFVQLAKQNCQNLATAATDTVAGVLDGPYKPAHRSCRTGPPVYIGWNNVQSPSYVAWRAGIWLLR